MSNIILDDKPFKLGKHRSEQEKNLRKDWGAETMSEEQLEKCTYLEKTSNKCQTFFDKEEIDNVGKVQKPIDPHFGHEIKVCGYSPQGRKNYDLIDWGSPKLEAKEKDNG